MKSNPHLRSMTAGGFTGVLAGIVRNKFRATACPTATECISNPKSIDQIVCTIDGAAAAAHIYCEVSR